MQQIYNAKNYFEEILLGSNFKGMGFVNESFHSHSNKYYSGYNQSRNFAEDIISVGLLGGNILEIGVDKTSLTTQLCGCVKNDFCKKLNLASTFVQVIPKTRYRSHLQLLPGTKIGHTNLAIRAGYGSLGGFIIPRINNGNLYAVSNNHVLADTNKGTPGDNVYFIGDDNLPIKIGTLKNYVPIQSMAPNKLDLAVAELENYSFNAPPNFAKCRKARLGERVYKYGASTGSTQGVVRSLNYTTKVNYGGFNAVFIDQIQIGTLRGPFSLPGDSGSIIKASNDHAHIGLLFGGNDAYTVANHQTDVANQLSKWGLIK